MPPRKQCKQPVPVPVVVAVPAPVPMAVVVAVPVVGTTWEAHGVYVYLVTRLVFATGGGGAIEDTV